MSQSWLVPLSASEKITDVGSKVSAALEALRTCHSGTDAPSSTVAFMYWADTTDGWMKMRNSSDDGWLYLWPLTSLYGGGVLIQFDGWVTHSSQTLTFPAIPVPHRVVDQSIDVTEAFDSDGSDEITGGNSDADAYCTAVDVSTTGLKTLTPGIEFKRYTAAGKTPAFRYTNGGSEPTTGKALCSLTVAIVPVLP